MIIDDRMQKLNQRVMLNDEERKRLLRSERPEDRLAAIESGLSRFQLNGLRNDPDQGVRTAAIDALSAALTGL